MNCIEMNMSIELMTICGIYVTCMVSRVLTNSSGYVSRVELTPAQAPATNEGGKGSLHCSPGFGERFLLTVS